MGAIFGLIFGFILHALAIFVGAKLAKLERVDFWRAATVALLSYIAILLASIALWPFSWVPLIGVFAGSLALGIGTTVTAKMVLDINWKPAAIIGVVAIAMGTLGGAVFHPFL